MRRGHWRAAAIVLATLLAGTAPADAADGPFTLARGKTPDGRDFVLTAARERDPSAPGGPKTVCVELHIAPISSNESCDPSFEDPVALEGTDADCGHHRGSVIGFARTEVAAATLSYGSRRPVPVRVYPLPRELGVSGQAAVAFVDKLAPPHLLEAFDSDGRRLQHLTYPLGEEQACGSGFHPHGRRAVIARGRLPSGGRFRVTAYRRTVHEPGETFPHTLCVAFKTRPARADSAHGGPGESCGERPPRRRALTGSFSTDCDQRDALAFGFASRRVAEVDVAFHDGATAAAFPVRFPRWLHVRARFYVALARSRSSPRSIVARDATGRRIHSFGPFRNYRICRGGGTAFGTFFDD